MELYYFLKNESETFERKLLIVSTIAGVFNGLIIGVIIISAGGPQNANITNLMLFALCVLIYARSRKYSMEQSSTIVEGVITKIRIRLTDKIRRADLISFEQMGKNRFYTCLAQDTVVISEAARVITGLLSSSVLLLFASLYIAYLSLPAFCVTAALVFGGILIHRQNSRELDSDLIEASIQENRFFEILGHLMEGFKELKINDTKCRDFFENYLKTTAWATQRAKVGATKRISKKALFAQCFSYILLSFMIFVFPSFVVIDSSSLIRIVTMLLFVTTGPLNEAVGSLPLVERANIAIMNLRKMEGELERITLDEDRKVKPRRFTSLACEAVIFDYHNDLGEVLFQVGPIDFDLKRGETVFVMGGNGAGKSTFLKLLIGLYTPSSGRILWNNREVGRKRLTDYRTNFAMVLQDYHLFDRLYGIEKIDFEKVGEMLERIQLEEKTAILPDGRFANLNLSAGQKKRLALIVAELDNREIYVFDEWAADQDPRFRKYFYEEYLQHLKSSGKTVLAVTHDEKYYHVADRVLQMEYGKLTEYHK